MEELRAAIDIVESLLEESLSQNNEAWDALLGIKTNYYYDTAATIKHIDALAAAADKAQAASAATIAACTEVMRMALSGKNFREQGDITI